MEFKSLKKIHDGHFIHRYDITYETVDGKEKVYEMISRNPDISTFSELQAKTPEDVYKRQTVNSFILKTLLS